MNGERKNVRVLEGKTILLGVCGGIAAYKAADLCRMLSREGAAVRVIMTASAREFIAPLTFSALTGNPVMSGTFDDSSDTALTHIDLANKADLFLVAPATANMIAKFAVGLADDLLSTTALVVTCPVIVAPAMNVHMYAKGIVQDNLKVLKERGWYVVEPEEGALACGAVGKGRLATLETIVSFCRRALSSQDFTGKKILVTAGGTREPLDPVRFISNYSSGKMGYALARAAWERGAMVTLISAAQAPPPVGVDYIQVQTASEMLAAVMELYGETDIVIKAAAVADFRPVEKAAGKIKKGSLKEWTIQLEAVPDILGILGEAKDKQLLIGFAAETDDLIKNAKEKLKSKNIDLIVANDITSKGSGFGSDTNEVTLVFPDGRLVELPCLLKYDVANHILEAIKSLPGYNKAVSSKGGNS